MLAPLDPESSWERFLVALKSDVEDIQGGTTREGIHMGVMSGTVDLMQRVYPGSEVRDGVLRFAPRLPPAVEQVAFRIQFQRTPLHVTLDRERLAIAVHREGAGGPIRVGVGDEVREVRPGESEEFDLSSAVVTGREPEQPVMSSSAAAIQGAIFGVDGVLVDSPHEKAWRESLRELMQSDWSDIRDRTTWSPEAFSSRVYEEQMSGGSRAWPAPAQRSSIFHVPDDEEEHRLLEYAERKQAMVVRLIEAGDFTAYPDALRFIIAVKDAGLRVAAASSSKNAGLFLRQIRLDTFAQTQGISSHTLHPGLTLLDYFDADVSGRRLRARKA